MDCCLRWLVVMVVALTILVLGVLARVDRALDEITSRPPSKSLVADLITTPLIRASGVGCWYGMPRISRRFRGWVVVGATSATTFKSRFQVQGTPYDVVIDGDGRVAAVGIPNKAVDIRRL